MSLSEINHYYDLYTKESNLTQKNEYYRLYQHFCDQRYSMSTNGYSKSSSSSSYTDTSSMYTTYSSSSHPSGYIPCIGTAGSYGVSSGTSSIYIGWSSTK